MKELVEYIAKSLVDDPDAVEVTESSGSGRRVVNLRVAPADMGKVIGKQGRIAQAIRTLLKIAAVNSGGNSGQPALVIDARGGDSQEAAFAETETPEAEDIDGEEKKES